MVNISPTRMRSATDARNAFNVLLGDAERGLVTHIMKGSRVVAHIVPADARIIDDAAVLELMLTTVGQDAATYAAENSWVDGRLRNAGDAMGHVLAWAWLIDRHVFSRALAIYHRALEHATGEKIGPPQLIPGVETALGVRLTDSDIREVAHYLATNDYWVNYYPAASAPFDS
jgi:antitoxin (DNA-binding transcriptional repressor) of toxin-antitoxin stability system